MSQRYLMLIRAVDKDAANTEAKAAFDLTGGEFIFTVPLFDSVATDDSTPTHYWASAEIDDDKVAHLQTLQASFAGSVLVPYSLSDFDTPKSTLDSLNLRTAKPILP